MLSVRPEVVDPKKGQQPSLLQKLESKFETVSLHFDNRERKLQISLLERKQTRGNDIADAEEIASKPTQDVSHLQLTTDDEEHEVDREDVNKTKWVSTCC